MRSLLSSLFLYGRIRTTEAKAKEARPLAEKYLTRAMEQSLSSRRYLAAKFSESVVRRMIDHTKTIGERRGGYTRIAKLGPRKSDGAKMAILELAGEEKNRNEFLEN
jgi:large subunit ribosomal protein L17